MDRLVTVNNAQSGCEARSQAELRDIFRAQ